jgi:polysaccharide export outer membrane protein
MKKFLLLLGSMFFIAGCTTKSSYVLFNKTDAAINESVIKLDGKTYDYKIMPEDRVSVTVYNHPKFSVSRTSNDGQNDTGILVSSKGYISMPLIGRTHIANLTREQAKKKIEKAFKKYNVSDAEVYIEVLNKKAYILGEVRTPGEVDIESESIGLAQMLAKSGGLTNAANRHQILILQRRGNSVYTKNVDMIGSDSIKSANLKIYPDDIVYVTPNTMKPIRVGVSEVFGLLGTVFSSAPVP